MGLSCEYILLKYLLFVRLGCPKADSCCKEGKKFVTIPELQKWQSYLEVSFSPAFASLCTSGERGVTIVELFVAWPDTIHLGALSD